MNVEKLVKEFFILDYSAAKPTYKLNEYAKLANYNWKNEQEAVEFLMDVIRYWHDKVQLACYVDAIDRKTKALLPENEWKVNFDTNSGCPGCYTFRCITEAIFDQFSQGGGFGFFLQLELYIRDGKHVVYFDILKTFVEGPKAAEIQVIELKTKHRQEIAMFGR